MFSYVISGLSVINLTGLATSSDIVLAVLLHRDPDLDIDLLLILLFHFS